MKKTLWRIEMWLSSIVFSLALVEKLIYDTLNDVEFLVIMIVLIMCDSVIIHYEKTINSNEPPKDSEDD